MTASCQAGTGTGTGPWAAPAGCGRRAKEISGKNRLIRFRPSATFVHCVPSASMLIAPHDLGPQVCGEFV